jgi:TolB-like protein
VISWKQLRERRIIQMTLAYIAVGWVLVSAVDQLVDRGWLPELVYDLGFVAYLGGIPAALIIGWYHGERGSQKVTGGELGLLALVLLITVAAGAAVWRDYRNEQLLAASIGLDAAFDPRRLAVLYFDDLSGGGEGELGPVADGLTEGLIAELSRVRALDVVSRNGVGLYRGAPLEPDSIGRALGAGSVINGSVESVGSQIRVNVRLVDAESGVDIDRTSFSMPMEQLLQARDSLVALTADFLRERLGDEVLVRGRRAETRSVDAWTHVQRAERLRKDSEVARRTDPRQALALLAQADSVLRTAQALDPAWTEPVALRAQVALQRALWSGRDDAVAAVSSGVALADSALALDVNHAGAWETRGTLQYYLYFLNVSSTPLERAALLDAAQVDLERAVGIDPDLASALNTLSRLHYDRKDRLSAALSARQALQADSYLRDAAATFDRLFWAHYDLGQFAEAERTCREAAARFPRDARFQQCSLWMMITPTAEADPDAAWALAERVDSLTSPDRRPFTGRVSRMIVGGVLARANLPDSARHVLEDARAGAEADPGQELPGYEAIMRTLLGDHEEAVRQLRRYVAANPDHEFFEVEGDLHWWWRPLRDQPGFSAVAAPRR